MIFYALETALEIDRESSAKATFFFESNIISFENMRINKS